MKIPVLARDSVTRYLGVHVGSRPEPSAIWSIAEQQILARLHLAHLKTTDTLQRVLICRAVVLPKVEFVARHVWPSRGVLERLHRSIRNFIWHGFFSPDRLSGRAWMSSSAAGLPLTDGGLAAPDVRQHLTRLASRTLSAWVRNPTAFGREVGRLLAASGPGAVSLSPRRVPKRRRHCSSIQAAGAQAVEDAATQARTPEELQLLCLLLERAGRGRLSRKDWVSGWLSCDFGGSSDQLHALRRYQEQAHGCFLRANLLRAKLTDTQLLLPPDRLPGWRGLTTGLSSGVATLRELLEVRWMGPGVVQFRCRTQPFPLSPKLAMRFRVLCDVLVANYPGLLLPSDPPDVLTVLPQSPLVWRVSPDADGYRLSCDNGAGVRACGSFRDRKELLRLLRGAAGPSDRPSDVRPHECFVLSPPIWDPRPVAGRAAPSIDSPERSHGLAEVAGRERRWRTDFPLLGDAVLSLQWTDIFRLPTATSAQRMLLHRIRGLRVSGWCHSLRRRGCPHCPALGVQGGTTAHIFWYCPAAPRVWEVLLRSWQQFGLWRGCSVNDSALAHAVLSLRLPANPPILSSLIHKSNCSQGEKVFPYLNQLWQSQVLSALQVLWSWRHSYAEGAGWPAGTAERRMASYLAAALRNAADAADDDAVALAVINAATSLALPRAVFPAPATLSASARTVTSPTYVLFFDGGSRGNPGPGGAGAIIVAVLPGAANVAMDLRSSMQTPYPAARPEWRPVLQHLYNDMTHWAEGLPP